MRHDQNKILICVTSVTYCLNWIFLCRILPPPPLGGNAFYKIMHFETIQIVFNLGPNEQKFQKALNCDQVNEL